MSYIVTLTILNIYKMKKILALFMITFVVVSCKTTHEKMDLTLNLEQGKEYKQITSSKMTIIQEFGGEQMEMKMDIKGIMTFLVKSVNDQDYDMEVSYNKLSMTMESQFGSMVFDSDSNDESDVFSNLLSQMKEKPFELKMSKKGKVTQIKNIEQLWESTIITLDYISEQEKEQIATQIKEAYGEEALMGNLEMVVGIFPAQPVAENSKWTITTNLQSGMSAKMTTEYELIEVNSDYIILKGNAVIKTDEKDAYIDESNGMPMRYELEGTMLSDIKLDRQTGWIIEAKAKQNIEGEAYINQGEDKDDSIRMPMT